MTDAVHAKEAERLDEPAPAAPLARLVVEPGRSPSRMVEPSGITQAQRAQAPPIELFRWATIAVGFILATSPFEQNRGLPSFVAGLVLAVYAGFRTLRPISTVESKRATREISLEFAFHIAVLMLSGAWLSSYAIVLLPTIALASFARGYVFPLELSLVASAILTIQYDRRYSGNQSDTLQTGALWLGLLVFTSVVASYVGNVIQEQARQQSLTVERLGRLAEANALLFQLNKIAQTLPSSLDMGEVLDSTLTKLKGLISFEAITVMLLEENGYTWSPVRELGNPDQLSLTTGQLPSVCLRALGHQGALIESELGELNGPGLWPNARAGLYTALSARGEQIGVVALEASGNHHFGSNDIEVLNGITDGFAYAVSNARLFGRLRNIGAEEERTRIARDLHDQIGQALAHLGFEMDRAVRAADRGEIMKPRLEELRGEVKGVTRMVRDTLYDLRTDVTESQDVRATMELFLSRVRERSGLDVHLDVRATGRLPLIQEREMWRVAKEAVINVERHAKATELTIRWRCDGQSAEVTIIDDGVGIDATTARLDSYGMMGMRERAASIGARLEIESAPSAGTTVRVTMNNP